MFKDFLQELGCVAVSFSTGGDAIACVRSFRPQIVFSSILLGDMSGFELCAKLRQMPETAEALIVAFTGDAHENSPSRAREAGFDHFFLKPVHVNTILELLDSYPHHREDLPRRDALTAR